MPNANTRWYRIITTLSGISSQDYINDMKSHMATLPGVVNFSFLPTLSGDGSEFVSIITTVILNASKTDGNAAMTVLGTHLTTDHGYNGIVITEVDSETVYP